MIDHQDPDFWLPMLRGVPVEQITKRELFAAMAMQGLLASGGTAWTGIDAQGCAMRCVQNADALIAELAKEKS